MRIQHNIMSMNAYRNYNTNTSALAKNLEKLSSGYKINRAGDDAAGLAISEKMRAQITGLNAAQKNVKDGISLVKTAEGAMQEIQDMLNRMDYLATQSANGTYDNPVDRKNLQKEVEALQTEIDRIADSANFNGIKLLDGSLDGSGNSLKTAQGAASAAAANVTNMKNALDKANAMQVAGKLTSMSSSDVEALFAAKSTSANPVGDVGTKTILETDTKETGEVGFTIDLDGVDYIMEGDDAKALTLKIGSATNIQITEAQIKTHLGNANLKAGDTISGADLAKVIAKEFNTAGGTAIQADGANADKYKISANGTQLKFAAVDNQAARPNRHFDVKLTSDATATAVDAVASKYTSGALASGTGGTITKDETITLKLDYSYVDTDGTTKTGTKNVSYTIQPDAAGTGTDDTAATIANALIKAINDDADLSKYFVASGSNAGIVLDAQTAGAVDATANGGTAGSAKVTGLTVTSAGAASKMELATAPTTGNAQVDGAAGYTPGLGNSYVNPGTENIVMAGEEGKDILASTVLTFTTDHLKDGSLIEIGGEKYRIALGENSAYKGDGTTFEGAKVVYLADENADLEKISSKLAEVAKDNAVFTVSHAAGTGGKIGLKQKESAKGTPGETGKTSLRTMAEFVNQVKVSTVTTAGDQAIKDKAIAEAQANYDAAVKKQEEADAKVAELSANPGRPLTLQIGDTSDKFNQMDVSVGDMHVNAMGAGKLNEGTPEEKEITKTVSEVDIGSQDGAHEAIDIIKNAINYVSGIRGDLGAVQNRLEHTANNLSVMAENIQDAESTIRDTDVAEEMMAYTKNNILIQSAQAMLAQANAVPQGVLQLLG